MGTKRPTTDEADRHLLADIAGANATHTPGPWTKQGGYLTIYTLTDCATNAIAHTLHHANSNGSVVTREQAEANANLIAAAPDMLDACKSVADGIERSLRLADDKNPICLATLASRVRVLRAAIAKAGGAA